MRVCFFVLLLAVVALQTRSSAGQSFAVRQGPQSEEDIQEAQCGRVLVRGSDQLTQSELCRLLDQVSQNPSDSAERDSATARVIDEYHRRGFLGVDLAWNELEMRAGISAPASLLTITEGPVYRLRRLEMIGNVNTRDNVIRRRVALNEGWPFDEELLALSITRINQLGIFEEFKRKDVGVKVNRKGHYVDLVFNLREKE
jgi:outer membrane protein assembly factor BamA